MTDNELMEQYTALTALKKYTDEKLKLLRSKAKNVMLSDYNDKGYKQRELRIGDKTVGTISITNIGGLEPIVTNSKAFNEWMDELAQDEVYGKIQFCGTPKDLEVLINEYPKLFKRVSVLNEEQILSHIKEHKGIPIFDGTGEPVEGVEFIAKKRNIMVCLNSSAEDVVRLVIKSQSMPKLLESGEDD